MINNTNTVSIEGTVIDHDEILKTFKAEEGDNFTRWIVRPLAFLTAIGVGVAMLFASFFMILVSLALVPLVAVSAWAIKSKLERDIANAEPVVATQE